MIKVHHSIVALVIATATSACSSPPLPGWIAQRQTDPFTDTTRCVVTRPDQISVLMDALRVIAMNRRRSKINYI